MDTNRTIKPIPFIIIFLSLAFSAWAQSPQAGAADEVTQGISLYNSGDYKAAVEKLSAAVKKQKENADAWYYLALAQLRSGDASRKSFENAIKLRPGHGPSHSGFAYLLLILNDLEKAKREAETAITIDSHDSDAHYVLAKVYSIQRKWEAALESSEAVLRINPGHGAALLLKTQSLVAQIQPPRDQPGKNGENKSEAQDRNSSELIRKKRLKLEQAQEVLGKYLSLRPNDSESVWWREQHEAMKAHITQLKDQEEGNWYHEPDKDGVTRPTIQYHEKGKYTEAALNRRITGTVIMRAIFNRDGILKDILVLEGLEAGLTWAAVEAARKIRFKPATKAGEPVTVVAYLEFDFAL
jgi:TonB family protein